MAKATEVVRRCCAFRPMALGAALGNRLIRLASRRMHAPSVIKAIHQQTRQILLNILNKITQAGLHGFVRQNLPPPRPYDTACLLADTLRNAPTGADGVVARGHLAGFFKHLRYAHLRRFSTSSFHVPLTMALCY